jgi:hypothetical protein
MSDIEPKAIAAGVQNVPTVIEAKAVQHVSRKAPLDALELRNRLMIRAWLGRYLVKATPYYSAAAFGLVLLQEFRLFGFQMDTTLLSVIVGAVIVTNGALLKVFGREVWRRSGKNP